MRRLPGYLLVSTLLMALGGCRFLHQEQVNYQTVASDSQHDTDLARAEHAKAIKLIHRHIAGKTVELDKADAHLQRALVADVSFGPAHNSLGMLYFWKRTLYLAAWEFEYAVKLMPVRSEPLYNLGLVFECADSFDRAIETYEKALCLAPNDPRLIGAMARAQVRKGASIEEVRPLLEKILFYDTRPEWIAWAKIELGTNPIALEHGLPVIVEPESIPQPMPAMTGPEAIPKPVPVLPSENPLRFPGLESQVPPQRRELLPVPNPSQAELLDEHQSIRP